MPRDWDAATYDRISEPQFRWGAEVVGWLELDYVRLNIRARRA